MKLGGSRRTLRVRTVLLTLATALIAASLTTPSRAATANSSWDGRFGAPGGGLNSFAVAVSGTHTYVGGQFATFNGEPFANIAQWNGKAWSPMGAGMDGPVRALAVVGSLVYAGGDFTHAGGVAARHLAVWNGKTWAAVGGGVSMASGSGETVKALAADTSGHLFVGGQFDHVGTTPTGGIPAWSIASYDLGAGAWSALGAGVIECAGCGSFARPGEVDALAVDPASGLLYAGGLFQKAGTVLTASFAAWSGSAWTGYGAGLTSSTGTERFVWAIARSSNGIFVGGNFQQADHAAAVGIARLTSGGWAGLGTFAGHGGANPEVHGIVVAGSTVYAAGLFETVDGVQMIDFAVYDGTGWSPGGGTGLDSGVFAAAPSGTTGVTLVGNFTVAGTRVLNHVATWTGNAWHTFGDGAMLNSSLTGEFDALTQSSTGIYAGGNFAQAGAVVTNSVARWTGTAWAAMSSGVTLSGSPGFVYAMATISGQVIAAGRFDRAGSVSASNIARWDGHRWNRLGTTGVNGLVHAMVVIAGRLYVAGSFTLADSKAVSDVAAWDPATNRWSRVGDATLDCSVWSMASYADRYLALGGCFTTVTRQGRSVTYDGLTIFDTQDQSAANGGYYFEGGVQFSGGDEFVEALTFDATGNLYVGGQFDVAQAGRADVGPIAASELAVVHVFGDGLWAPLGSGADNVVHALALVNGLLYAAGAFTQIGTATGNGTAVYDPATDDWTALGTGLGDDRLGDPGGRTVFQSAPDGLYVGGQFGTAGGKSAAGLAIWTPTQGQT